MYTDNVYIDFFIRLLVIIKFYKILQTIGILLELSEDLSEFSYFSSRVSHYKSAIAMAA